jgi:hypothetical protein
VVEVGAPATFHDECVRCARRNGLMVDLVEGTVIVRSGSSEPVVDGVDIERQ